MKKRVVASSLASSSSSEEEPSAALQEELDVLKKQQAKAEDYWSEASKKAAIGCGEKVGAEELEFELELKRAQRNLAEWSAKVNSAPFGSEEKAKAKDREAFYMQTISELEYEIELKKARRNLAKWSAKVDSAPFGSAEETKAKEREAFYLQRISELKDEIELKKAQRNLAEWSAKVESAAFDSKEKVEAKDQQTIYLQRVRELQSHIKEKELRRISASFSSSATIQDDEHTQFVRNVKQAELVLGAAPAGKNLGKIFVEVKSVENEVLSGEGQPPKCLVIVTLPAIIPGFEMNPSPDQLFLLETDLQLIQLLAKSRRNAVAGNPGVGKSVLQWKIIVLLLRPDLWDMLRNAFTLSCVRENFVLDITFPLERLSKIIRVVGASVIYIFDFQDYSELKVERVNYHGSMLYNWNHESTLVLWEPAESLEPVPLVLTYKLKLTATVPPYLRRYKECIKQGAAWLFAPCPTIGELIVMGNAAYERSGRNPLYEPERIFERIAKFGPYTRYVVPQDANMLERVEDERADVISHTTASDMLKYPAIESGEGWFMSPFLVRIVLNRDDPKSFLAVPAYKPTSKDFQIGLAMKAKQMADLVDLRAELEYLSENADFLEIKSVALQAFVIGMLRLQKESTFDSYSLFARKRKQKLTFPRMKVVKVFDLPSWSIMEPNVMYYPTDPSYPIVDFVWREEEGTLHIGQVSLLLKHEQPVDVFFKLLKHLDVLIEDSGPTEGHGKKRARNEKVTEGRINTRCSIMYDYFTWSYAAQHYAKGRPESNFFLTKGMEEDEERIRQLRRTIDFRSCIVPLSSKVSF